MAVIITAEELRQELQDLQKFLADWGRNSYKPNRKEQMWLLVAEHLFPELLKEYFPEWNFEPGDSCICLVKK